ncbi:MAG: response regulator transcription factor, partial [Deltaproteobacteria bacterium]|nr:response regulator transcription factor [Deltaproteobacteria bacterium]
MDNAEVNKNLNIAVVISEGLFRDGLCSLLRSNNHNLVTIEDSLGLIEEKYESIKPDVVIVECDIAKENEDCLRRLTADRQARVAIICHRIDDKTFIIDVKMGISCLCYKESSDTLLDELRLISQGDTVISKGILTGIEGEDKERGIPLEGLTRREAEVVCYVGKGYSNK